MAGITFTVGQSMTRPGVYNRYVQVNTPLYAGVNDGIVACAFRAQWGPMGEVTEIGTLRQAQAAFGGDCEIVRQALAGGAQTVYAVRVGSGGGKAVCVLRDAQGAAAVNVEARYAGARPLSYELRSAGEARQFVLSEAGRVLESISFASGGDEAAALAQAGAQSQYLAFELAAGRTVGQALALVTETAMSAGSDPETGADEYAEAFASLTPYAWNCLCVDTDEVAVHAALKAYMAEAAREGHLGFAVLGEGVGVPLKTRMEHARAFNDYRVVYVGGGWHDSAGALVDGWRAAARVAGMIACVPASRSITHRTIDGAVRCAETLTSSQYVDCTQAGMLTFSASPTAQVWVENAITALSAPGGEDDRGWMKIKRARIRFELMDRANATVSPMVGNVANDSDGRAAVIQALQGLLRAMTAEGKLLAGASVYEDPDVPPAGDSAGFVIEANDVDALEKVYFTYRFSFAQA